MKKLLLATFVAGLMSTSAMAATWTTGTVDEIYVLPTGTYVTVNGAAKYLDATNLSADLIKAQIAILLTAQASGGQVSVTNGGCIDINKWCKVKTVTLP